MNSEFHGNSASTYGVLMITDSYGTALSMFYTLTLEVVNCVFEGNRAETDGSSVTIVGSVPLSRDSHITEGKFVGNECGEGGAGVHCHYPTGALHINSCVFIENKGETGAAIWSTHHDAAQLMVDSCLFQRNEGSSIVAVTSPGGVLTSNRNTFQHSLGTAVMIYQGVLQDTESIYDHNSGFDAGAMQFSTSAQGYLRNLILTSNTATHQGGAITAWLDSTITCHSSEFRNNTCGENGGAVFLEETSTLNGTNLVFKDNKSGGRGSAVFALVSKVNCANCRFDSNLASEFAAVFMMGTNATLTDSIFTSNEASLRSPGVMVALSSVYLHNCTFMNHTGNEGSFIFANDQSYLHITKSSFINGYAAAYGGCFYLTVNSTLILQDSFISACIAVQSGSVLRCRTGIVRFIDVTIRNVTSSLSSGALSISDSSVELKIDCADMIGSVVQVSTSVLVISHSQFVGTQAANGAAINAIDCDLVTIQSSSFIGGLAKRGGAVYAYASGTSATEKLTMYDNCSFISNRAVNGGAIYSDSVSATVTNCYFFNNTVSPDFYASREILYRGIGAALYTVNPNTVFEDYKIVNNTFENNTATYMGAADYWFDTYPTFENNTLIGNFAPYGSAVASFPIRLSLLHPNNSLIPYLSQDSTPLVLVLTQAGSGLKYDGSIRLALVDQYDVIVSTDSISSATIAVGDKNTSSLAGTVNVGAVSGVFEFTELTFIGEPKSTQNFLVSTNGIDPYLKKFATDPHDYYQTVRLEVSFRDCQAGESYQGLSCYLCPAGTYSLTPTHHCTSCPTQAQCLGGFQMVPEPGYWRPDPLTDLFLSCPNPDACTGSPTTGDISLTGKCADGYSGNLCSVCLLGFSRQSLNLCSKCPGLTSNLVVTSLVVVGALCMLGLAITIAVRGANKPRSQIAIYVKIFMNYLQIIVVAASLNLSWPGLVKLFLNGQEMAGSLAEQLFSFDCIAQEFNPTRLNSTKLISASLLPAVLIALSGVTWGAIALCTKQTSIRHKLVCSAVMILFITHPSLTKIMLEDFSCREIMPGELWLTSDLSQRCWDSEHIREIVTTVLPGLIVWGFGLPTLALGFLIKFRYRLNDKMISLQFSFLYKGYTEKWFYWEFVILYRKVALICSSVFFNSVSTMIQALSVLAVLLICLFLQIAVKPFAVHVFNVLEVKSLLVSLITIYSGLYFEANSMNEVLNILIFLLILLANGYFLLGWGRAVLPILLETIRRRISCSKRHFAIRPIPAKYDESIGDSNSFSKVTGTQHLSAIDVRCMQGVPEAESVPPITPPVNTVNLEVEHSVEGDPSEYVASAFQEIGS